MLIRRRRQNRRQTSSLLDRLPRLVSRSLSSSVCRYHKCFGSLSKVVIYRRWLCDLPRLSSFLFMGLQRTMTLTHSLAIINQCLIRLVKLFKKTQKNWFDHSIYIKFAYSQLLSHGVLGFWGFGVLGGCKQTHPKRMTGNGQLTRGAFRINDLLRNPNFSENLALIGHCKGFQTIMQ